MRKCAESWESIKRCTKSWDSRLKCNTSWVSMTKGAKSYESVLKAEKVWQSGFKLRKFAKSWECWLTCFWVLFAAFKKILLSLFATTDCDNYLNNYLWRLSKVMFLFCFL